MGQYTSVQHIRIRDNYVAVFADSYPCVDWGIAIICKSLYIYVHLVDEFHKFSYLVLESAFVGNRYMALASLSESRVFKTGRL